MAAGVNVALSQSQAAFFSRMSRPSGIITTDADLGPEQLGILRKAWAEQSAGMEAGGIPILGGGMKFQSLGITSQDAQLIEAQRMSIEDIARVYGVPLPVIGDLSHSTMNNVEQLISLWLSVSLGALLENIERSLDALFDLPANEYIELDTSALLRTDFMGRINGLTKGVQGGIFTPNEARSKEGLHPVDHGDVPYLQQQMQPIGFTPDNPPIPGDDFSPEDAKTLLKGVLH
jgi:HK97 family phage portal protein